MVKLKHILMATAVSTLGMLGTVQATNAELIIFDWGGY